ncbi:MAG: GIY-YIG nuclease family protein [Solirubrobacteraceae bacterium]
MAHAYVYLLRCADDSLYCGWTVDLERRLAAHHSGKGSAYVRRRLPARYAAAWTAQDRSHAMSAEALIKRLSRPEKLALIRGGPLPAALGPLLPCRPPAGPADPHVGAGTFGPPDPSSRQQPAERP